MVGRCARADESVPTTYLRRAGPKNSASRGSSSAGGVPERVRRLARLGGHGRLTSASLQRTGRALPAAGCVRRSGPLPADAARP